MQFMVETPLLPEAFRVNKARGQDLYSGGQYSHRRLRMMSEDNS